MILSLFILFNYILRNMKTSKWFLQQDNYLMPVCLKCIYWWNSLHRFVFQGTWINKKPCVGIKPTHGFFKEADGGSRTRLFGLGSRYSTDELHLQGCSHPATNVIVTYCFYLVNTGLHLYKTFCHYLSCIMKICLFLF